MEAQQPVHLVQQLDHQQPPQLHLQLMDVDLLNGQMICGVMMKTITLIATGTAVLVASMKLLDGITTAQ